MKAMIKNTLLSIVGISIVLLALAACGSEPAASKPTVEAPSSGSAQATVEAPSGECAGHGGGERECAGHGGGAVGRECAGHGGGAVERECAGHGGGAVERECAGHGGGAVERECAGHGGGAVGRECAGHGGGGRVRRPRWRRRRAGVRRPRRGPSGGSEQATVEASPGGTPKATLKIKSGRKPNASVSGSVTYRERLALSPGAKLVVELRDVSYQDAAAPLIARQTINGPGQVPITFKVEYNRDDIDSRNIYGISARIIESDGRLAFINDTAYDVITRGKPSKVDMLLVLVQPPPEQVEEGTDWRQWVETPAKVSWANLIPNEPELFLRIGYYQSTIENCARPGSQGLKVQGKNIVATITLMQPPPTSWAIPCDEQLVELDAVEPIGNSLKPGQTYYVIVNDVATTSFSLPRPSLQHTVIAESPIHSAEIEIMERAPTQYQLHVVSAMPVGSSCSQFNGYEIRRRELNEIEVVVTYHQIAARSAICTKDYPMVETNVPLGSDFESGEKYTVRVNKDTTVKFVAH